MAYAKREDGLPAQLDKDRREEMVGLTTEAKRILYALGAF